jgi:hypothetical protein
VGEGAHELRVHSVDAAGNAEPEQRVALRVDSVAPSGSLALSGDLQQGWYRGPVQATLACSDATSGVAERAWRLDGGAWQGTDGAFEVARAGTHTLDWRCVDAAGNSATGSAQLSVDLGAPQTVPALQGARGEDGWWTGPVQVAVEASAGLAGVAAVHVAVDGGAAQAYDGPFTLGEGRHTVAMGSEDDAGRVEEEHSVEVDVDSTAPTPRLDALGPASDEAERLVVGRDTLVLAGAGDGGSGVARVQMRVDDDAWLDAVPTRIAEPGAHSVDVRAVDAAGNAAELHRVVFVDREPPAVAVLRPADQSVDVAEVGVTLPARVLSSRAVLVGPVPLEAAASDADSGIARVEFRVDGQLQATVTQAPWVWDWSLLPDPQHVAHVVRIDAVDGAGNRNATTFTVLALGTVPGLLAAGLPPATLAVAMVAVARRRA